MHTHQVFLGAAAVMSNGTVMGRAGNAAVAMMAHAHSKPVLVCCESFKFHERVQVCLILCLLVVLSEWMLELAFLF